MSTDREDRWGSDDDRGYRDDAGGDADVRERAKQKVKWPAIGLIVVGVISLGLAGYFVITVVTGSFEKDLDAQMAVEQKKVDDDPNLTAQQKKDAKEMQNKILDFVKTAAPGFAAPMVIAGLLVIFGGVRLMSLSGRGLPMFSAILAMIPCCVSYTCVLGIPIGIWVMVVLTNPDVKAAFAAGPRPR